MSVACRHIRNRAILVLINNCRIWLQVTTLAEITNTNGTHIMACALTGAQDSHNKPLLWQISHSKLRWPQQTRPDPATWRVWKRFLYLLTLVTTTLLKYTLGPWPPYWNQHRTWCYLTTHRRNIIAHRSLNTAPPSIYTLKRRATGWTQIYYLTTRSDTIPDEAIYPITPSLTTNTHIFVTDNTSYYTLPSTIDD
jgi:hypothetical protein